MSNNTGGPAFPQTEPIANEFHPHYGKDRGMTLRDYFAAKAMQSLIAVYNDDKNIVKDYAQRAYQIADAMLEVREA